MVAKFNLPEEELSSCVERCEVARYNAFASLPFIATEFSCNCVGAMHYNKSRGP